MRFSSPHADIYVPDGLEPRSALGRITDLCIAAHQDDIEIMAYAGIADCLETPNRSFGGVVVTNGAGSPRQGPFAAYSDEQMQAVRREEQRLAARKGRYGIQIQLGHPSSLVKQRGAPDVVADLASILEGARVETLYVHNPADKHDTHIAVLGRTLEALRRLPVEKRPSRMLGCEVWRDLDWLVDADKVALDSGRHPALAADLVAVFASQIAGGKRYDLATQGRRAAHATFHTSHATDRWQGITWAIDLSPLLADPTLDLTRFTLAHVDRLRADIEQRLHRFGS